jgi:putative peptide zinc metalloprotease protein
MNLAEVLNVALPELPARRIGKSNPRLHPKLIAREQMKDGILTVIAMVSGSGGSVFFFTPEQWKMVGFFDGEHSYREISAAYTREMGVVWGEEDVRAFADQLDEAGLFYKTALALNSTASQKLTEERRRRTQKKINATQMTFSTWDPDSYLSKLNEIVSFVYTTWFTLLTLSMFTVMALIFLSGWSEIWRDTTEYYTFTHKGAADLAEFWLLFCGLGFFHESAHGLTCKHFGGEVHRMGFMLLYLSPAFFVDITEVYVYGGKWQRAAAIIAGIWVELMFCSVASIVWWGTPLGSPVHDFAYKIMLITGVAVVLMNLNPLIKLDGYYLFGELVGVPTLKENSTEYVSSWVKCNLFRMPVEIPYLRPRRRWLFAGYALLSGLYSYLILFAVIRFSFNIFSRVSPQWAFVPALGLALLIFRGRLRSLARFMKDFYLDKRQTLRAWWTPLRRALLGAAVVLALFAPVWRETVTSRFVLEPEQRAVIRATVPGQITEVLTEEGSPIAAGTPVLRMRNAKLEEEAARSLADLSLAEANARQAQLNYADLGHARSEQASQVERYRSFFQQLAVLRIVSPISGVVMTPRIRNLAGSFVAEGTELAEVDDIQTLRARIFVPDFEIRRVTLGAPVSLKLESQFRPIRGRVASISAAPLDLAPGLLHVEPYKGIAPPPYYVATVLVPNAQGMIRVGTSGDAKILVRWRSSAWFLWENVREFVQRKVW